MDAENWLTLAGFVLVPISAAVSWIVSGRQRSAELAETIGTVYGGIVTASGDSVTLINTTLATVKAELDDAKTELGKLREDNARLLSDNRALAAAVDELRGELRRYAQGKE